MEMFNENTGLYLFSALLQANAAILAIAGVFGIFKIQSINSKIDFLKNVLHYPHGRHMSTGLSPKDINSFEKKTHEEKVKQMSETKDDTIKIMLSDWVKYEKQIMTLNPIIINSSKYLGFGIIINAIGIIFSNLIHNMNICFESIIFLIVLVFHGFIISQTAGSIKKLMYGLGTDS